MDRFWKQVRKSSGCWEWGGAKTHNGYGRFYLNGKTVRAHRFSWEMVNGPIQGDLIILHKCDNPACVNPDHLSVGTQKDNVEDCMRKGRKPMEGENNYFYKNPMSGEKNGRAKLTKEQALYILNSKGTVGQAELAITFGINKRTVSAIQNGKIWKCLSTP